MDATDATTSTDSTAQEQLSQLRKQILKLRWMGMMREADELARSAPSVDAFGGGHLPLSLAETD